MDKIKESILSLINNILFLLFTFVVVVLYLYPLLIRFKRWCFDKVIIEIIYPVDFSLLKVYYIIYFLLFLFLLYRLYIAYFRTFVDDFGLQQRIYKYINYRLDQVWDFIEKNIWQITFLRLKFERLTVYLVGPDAYFYYNGQKINRISLFYYSLEGLSYIGLFVCIFVLYIEVLYYNRICYIYYFLVLLFLPVVLRFVLNRCYAVCLNSLQLLMSCFSFYKQVVYAREYLPDNALYTYSDYYYYFDPDPQYLFLVQKYIDCNGKYYYDYYTVNLFLSDSWAQRYMNNLLVVFFGSARADINYSKTWGENMKNLTDEDLLLFQEFIINTLRNSLNSLGLMIAVLASYRNKIKSTRLLIMLIRLFSLLCLMSIVLCF